MQIIENFSRVQQDEHTLMVAAFSRIHEVQLVPHHFLQVLCMSTKITINKEENICI